MAIIPPVDGATATDATSSGDILSMYAAVQAKLNELETEDIGRSTFAPHHLGSILGVDQVGTGAQSSQVTGFATVNHRAVNPDSGADILAWERLRLQRPGWRVTGATLPERCWLLYGFYAHIADVSDAGNDERNLYMLAPVLSFGGKERAGILERSFFGQDSDLHIGREWPIEAVGMLSIDGHGSDVGLNYIEVVGATYPAVASAASSNTFRVQNGCVWWMIFPRE